MCRSTPPPPNPHPLTPKKKLLQGVTGQVDLSQNARAVKSVPDPDSSPVVTLVNQAWNIRSVLTLIKLRESRGRTSALQGVSSDAGRMKSKCDNEQIDTTTRQESQGEQEERVQTY